MDEMDRAPAVQDRNTAFGQGVVGGQVQPPPSLMETASRYNSEVPNQFRPSVTGNGMSASQKQATYSGMYRTTNGQADDTYELAKFSEPAAQ